MFGTIYNRDVTGKDQSTCLLVEMEVKEMTPVPLTHFLVVLMSLELVQLLVMEPKPLMMNSVLEKWQLPLSMIHTRKMTHLQHMWCVYNHSIVIVASIILCACNVMHDFPA